MSIQIALEGKKAAISKRTGPVLQLTLETMYPLFRNAGAETDETMRRGESLAALFRVFASVGSASDLCHL